MPPDFTRDFRNISCKTSDRAKLFRDGNMIVKFIILAALFGSIAVASRGYAKPRSLTGEDMRPS